MTGPVANTIRLALVPAGKAALAAIGFGISIHIGRVLGAEGFGIYAAATATMVVFAGIIQHVADVAYLRALEDDRPMPEAVAIRANMVLRAMGVAVSLMVMAIGYGLCRVTGIAMPFSGLILAVIGVGVAATVVLSGAQIVHQARTHYKSYLALDFALYGLRATGLLVLTLAGKMASFPVLCLHALAPALAVLFSPVRQPGRATAADVRRGMTRMLHLGGWIGLAFAFSILTSKLDLLMLAFLSTAREAGLYAAAINLAILAEFAGSFLLVVFYPNILRWHREGHLRSLLLRFMGVAVPVAALCAMGAVGNATLLLTAAYGPDFADAAPIFAVLAPLCLFMMTVQPLAAPFINLSAPRTLCAIEGAGLAVAVVALAILVPRHGALGAAWALLVVRGSVGATILLWAYANARPETPYPPVQSFFTDEQT